MRRVLLVAIVHFVMAALLLGYGYAAGMQNFDAPGTVPWHRSDLLFNAATVLMFPLTALGDVLPNMPNPVEQALVFANSLLWGYVLTRLWTRWHARQAGGHHA